MRNAIKYILLIMLMCFISGLCGCERKEADVSNEHPLVMDFEPLNEHKEGQKNVYLIVKAFNNNYWDNMLQYIKSAAEEKGCNVFYSGSMTEAEWQAQETLLHMAEDRGADAIIFAPDNSSDLAGTVSEIYNKGIPVVLIDTPITVDDYDVCYMTDNLLAGHNAAKELLYQLELSGANADEELQVGIQVGSASSQTINERLAGFSQYWSEHAPGKWTIIDDVKVNGGDLDVAERYSEELLDKYPKLKGVFGCNNGSTIGLAKVLINKGRKDIAIVGFDYSEDIANLINTPGYYGATMLQRQSDMGYYSVEAVMNLMNGIEMTDKFVDTGVVVANKETINTPEVVEVLSTN